MLFRLSVLVIVAACAMVCLASGLGKCPRHEYVHNFNMSRFAGQWYEVERSFYLMELTSNCVTINLVETRRGQLHVCVKTVGKWSGSVKESVGTAAVSKRDPSVYQYRVNTILPNALARFLPGSGVYQVLNTDYDNYAIIWTCSSVGLAYTDMVWVLGRSKEVSVGYRTAIYDFLMGRHIDTDRLIASNSNCSI